jgi:hypothetical protein
MESEFALSGCEMTLLVNSPLLPLVHKVHRDIDLQQSFVREFVNIANNHQPIQINNCCENDQYAQQKVLAHGTSNIRTSLQRGRDAPAGRLYKKL